jgi:hypothetical protein
MCRDASEFGAVWEAAERRQLIREIVARWRTDQMAMCFELAKALGKTTTVTVTIQTATDGESFQFRQGITACRSKSLV